MSTELRPLDVSASPELLRLAEEVQQSGVGRVLTHGDREIAILTPVKAVNGRRRAQREVKGATERDSLLNIIGIGESTEPTDIARYQHEYLAEAYENKQP